MSSVVGMGHCCYHFLFLFGYQDFDANIKPSDFSIQTSTKCATCVKCSIGTSVVERKSVVTEEDGSDHRDNSLLVALFGIFRLTEF